MTCYRWVLDRKAEGFPITIACKIAEVSRQAFNDWRAKAAGGRPTPSNPTPNWWPRCVTSKPSSTAPTASRG